MFAPPRAPQAATAWRSGAGNTMCYRGLAARLVPGGSLTADGDLHAVPALPESVGNAEFRASQERPAHEVTSLGGCRRAVDIGDAEGELSRPPVQRQLALEGGVRVAIEAEAGRTEDHLREARGVQPLR